MTFSWLRDTPADYVHEDSILRIAAFLGRYGHQPVDVVLRLPRRTMEKLQTAIEDIMSGEGPIEAVQEI